MEKTGFFLAVRRIIRGRTLAIGLLLIIFAGNFLLLTGCKTEDTGGKKIKDLEFTIVEDADVPEPLMKMINEKKKEPFKLSYSDTENLYIVVGYGEQPTGGYSIAVNAVYLTDNAVVVDTDLLGPGENEQVTNALTYPYVVIKTAFIDKTPKYK
ncbi:protease complex subunit PrcB family protein [Anaerocolumna xylanovorans]|uniref:PrcB C-terminal n=1 Tax=Anaerocolumna xylanovorans DSM 12503 TaxID=1121345 RepID=A0A1M7YK10_9FIRM|nr:protease complex subunit PrcB family protein [Anaerocolumna xylanovorans]SHO52965.1 PrcB C-terminal [Anaerocolumna xylanovorans DSM 12503]